MPVYTVEIVKGLTADAGLKTWRNVYHLDTGNIGDAFSAADTIVNAEVDFHASTTTFYQKIVSDPSKVERRLTYNIPGVTGARTISGAALPIWNVVDVLISTVSNPRPLFKYYRVILGEGDVVGTALESTLVTLIQDELDALNATLISLCAPNGDSWQSPTVQSNVGMRQPKWQRRWRKGFHRGYVPNA